MCAMGYKVTAVERNPFVAALLKDAAWRARRSEWCNVPRIVLGDAIQFLAGYPNQWDCVYIDPMFPPKRRASTLAKRPMRLLRELVGDDPDKRRLFDAADVAAMKRIVVKRPDCSAPIFGEPNEVISGKLVNYDVCHMF
ncbi:MAG: Ribosomal RNA small subunit methyltransferase J [Gammaproteobacteria bacterium]|nr:Ribosomal RNA small subunit methyltransferase J [Gammaproteobacteria bacterium]